MSGAQYKSNGQAGIANERGAQNFIDQLNDQFNQEGKQGDQAQEERKRKDISEQELIGMIKQNKGSGRKFPGNPAGAPRGAADRRS